MVSQKYSKTPTKSLKTADITKLNIPVFSIYRLYIGRFYIQVGAQGVI